MVVRETFSYLQVERPVIGGAADVLSQSRLIGERVLGFEQVSSIRETAFRQHDDGDMGDQAPSIEVFSYVQPIGAMVLNVMSPGDVKAILLHRRVPMRYAPSYKFDVRSGELNARTEPDYCSADTRVYERWQQHGVSLMDQLNQVALDARQDPERTVMMCDRIQPLGVDHVGTVLGLLGKPTDEGLDVLQMQARVSQRRYARHAGRWAYPEQGHAFMYIPFAIIPETVPREAKKECISQLQGVVNPAQPARLVFGHPDKRAKSR